MPSSSARHRARSQSPLSASTGSPLPSITSPPVSPRSRHSFPRQGRYTPYSSYTRSKPWDDERLEELEDGFQEFSQLRLESKSSSPRIRSGSLPGPIRIQSAPNSSHRPTFSESRKHFPRQSGPVPVSPGYILVPRFSPTQASTSSSAPQWSPSPDSSRRTSEPSILDPSNRVPHLSSPSTEPSKASLKITRQLVLVTLAQAQHLGRGGELRSADGKRMRACVGPRLRS